MHYYYVCTISPGFVDDPPVFSGSGLLWASPSCHQLSYPGLEVVKARMTRCKKCGEMRPEVQWLLGLVTDVLINTFGEGPSLSHM